MKVTILGCGSSGGTPAAGGFWGNCDPENPKNYRRRASILVEEKDTTVLVDTTVDVRDQLTDAKIQHLDGILYTHCHSDHINGMDDLRVISYTSGAPINTFSNQHTMDDFERRYNYVAHGGYNGVYKPFLKPHVLKEYDAFQVGDLDIECFPQHHANIGSVGFRFDKFAYSVDVLDFDDEAFEKLEGIDVWVVDGAGFRNEHIATHAGLPRVQKWVERLKPKMTYITVLTGMMDYDVVCDELPPNIRPCYDGQIIDI